MDPAFLFRSTAEVQADAARRQSLSSPRSSNAGLPNVGASGLGLGGSASTFTPEAGLAAASVSGGGLGSSPNVPAPGTSINPATGLPHTAGLTRQELAAKRAAEEHASKLSELSGRQQAAAQLVGTGPVIAGTPASPTMSERSVIDDVTQQISKLGHRTYDALPPAIKDVFAEPKGKGPEGSPIKPRRGSAAAIFENVKSTASRLSHDLQDTVSKAMAEPDAAHQSVAARRGSILADANLGGVHDQPPAVNADITAASPARRESLLRGSGASSSPKTGETSVFQQVKGFLAEAFEAPPADGYPAVTAATGHRTLPSQENQGARPGEVSAGAGALPGKVSEAGVAVPPDVRTQEGTDGGKIITSTPTTATSASTAAAPAPIPVPVSVVDVGGFGSAFVPVIPVSSTADQLVGQHTHQAGGPPHANVPVTEKTGIEEAIDQFSEKAKNFLGLGAAAGTAAGVGLGAAAIERGFERGSETSSTSATDVPSTAAASTTSAAVPSSTTTTGISGTKGVSDLAPPIPATQTGVLTDKGVDLAPSSAPAGIAIAPRTSSINQEAAAPSTTSGTSTPVPRAGALGAGSSEAVLTPSEAAVAAQSASYMDAHASSALPAPSTTSTGSADKSLAVGPDADKPLAGVPPNERLDSLASVTAIRHGQPGVLKHSADDTPPVSSSAATAAGLGAAGVAGGAAAVVGTHGSSPLASTAEHADGEANGYGQKSTVRGTGPNHTTSLTPGKEEHAIGHPASRGEETQRTPGSYPEAQHGDVNHSASSAATDSHAIGTSDAGRSSTTTAAAASESPAAKHDVADKEKDKTGSSVPPAAAAAIGVKNETGHRRGSSTASNDSKKVGFMKKLKGEMKVISGKLGHNEEKVQLGEKIKHGEA